jgi:hypothetical protein
MRPESEIIQLGNYVEQLFNQEYFNTLYEEFKEQSVAYMLRTEPHEQKAREGIYARINGAREFMELMGAYVAARDEILRRQEEDDAHPLEDGEWYQPH